MDRQPGEHQHLLDHEHLVTSQRPRFLGGGTEERDAQAPEVDEQRTAVVPDVRQKFRGRGDLHRIECRGEVEWRSVEPSPFGQSFPFMNQDATCEEMPNHVPTWASLCDGDTVRDRCVAASGGVPTTRYPVQRPRRACTLNFQLSRVCVWAHDPCAEGDRRVIRQPESWRFT